MNGDSDRERVQHVKEQVGVLLGKHEFEHVTIDVELEGEDCASGWESASRFDWSLRRRWLTALDLASP